MSRGPAAHAGFLDDQRRALKTAEITYSKDYAEKSKAFHDNQWRKQQQRARAVNAGRPPSAPLMESSRDKQASSYPPASMTSDPDARAQIESLRRERFTDAREVLQRSQHALAIVASVQGNHTQYGPASFNSVSLQGFHQNSQASAMPYGLAFPYTTASGYATSSMPPQPNMVGPGFVHHSKA